MAVTADTSTRPETAGNHPKFGKLRGPKVLSAAVEV